MAWSPDFTFDLLDRDGSFVSTVTDVVKPGFHRRRSAPGYGKIVVDPGALAVSSLLSTFLDGRYIQAKQDGVAVFTWRIEQPAVEDVDPDDEPDDSAGLIVDGRGWVADFDDAVVEPWGGVTQRPPTDTREFGFASPDLPVTGAPLWSSPVSEGDGIALGRYLLDVEGNQIPAPGGFPVASAEWLAANDPSTGIGRSYFRSTLTVPGTVGVDEVYVAFAATADNYYTVYLDGRPIIGDESNEGCWREWRPYEITLGAGDHTVAVVVENIAIVGGTNPSALRLAAYTVDGDGEPDTVLLTSTPTSYTWVSSYVPSDEPGWTPGELIAELVADAVATDADNPVASWSLGFDDDVDTNGDAWDRIATVPVTVGSSVLDVLDRLVDDGIIIYDADPSTRTLNMWRADYSSSSGVTLVSPETSIASDGSDINLLGVKFPPTAARKSKLLVRYPGGAAWVEDASATTELGATRVGSISVDAPTHDEAVRVAEAALASITDPAAVATVEPTGTSDVPLDDFTVNETVQMPGPDDVVATFAVVGIAVDIDDADEPEYTVTFGGFGRGDLTTRQADTLRSLGLPVTGSSPKSRPVTTSQQGGAYSPPRLPVVQTYPRRQLKAADLGDATIGGGGASGWYYQWTVPGLVNYLDESPAVVVLADATLTVAEVTFKSDDGVEFDVLVNGSVEDSVVVTGDDTVVIDVDVTEGDQVSIEITDIGAGAADGMWVGLR